MLLRQSLLSFAAVVGLGAMPAAATAACVSAPTSKAFSKVGDNADYSVAPGGDFESGAAGWSLTGGAKVVGGNESLGWFKGSILPGSKALAMPVGSTATSPEFCVDETNPYFRFMAKADSSMAGYEAIVIYRNAAGAVTSTQFTSSSEISWGSGNWVASKVSPLATKIPLDLGATASVQLKFVSTGNAVAVGVGLWGRLTGGSVAQTLIDSVMVDPYRRG
ncbi:MAG: hypothetical protein J7513_14025 [Solirubrobacteraceae bacterium]|nr:hypothetical protein [Solirubrobacteraceae bacterium]